MSKFNESYQEYYRIIEEVKLLGRLREDKIYYEKHHIIPRSLGGSNKNNNLILLTPEEHYLCHSLLPDFCDGSSYYSMVKAWHLMNYTRDVSGLEIIGPKKYGILKRAYQKSNSGKNHPMARSVLQINYETYVIIKRWPYAKLASEKLNINHGNLTWRATHVGPAGGFLWEYEDIYNYEAFKIKEDQEKEKILKNKINQYSKMGGELNPSAKEVLQINIKDDQLIKTWPCAKAAADFYGVSSTNITSCVSGKRKTSCGFKWARAYR